MKPSGAASPTGKTIYGVDKLRSFQEASPLTGQNIVVQKKNIYGGSICGPTSLWLVDLDLSSTTFSPNVGGLVVDHLRFRFSSYRSILEIFTIKVEIVGNRAEFWKFLASRILFHLPKLYL